MNGFVYSGDTWEKIKAVYCFHEGIGFVKLHSIKVFSDNEWKIVDFAETRELIGSSNG